MNFLFVQLIFLLTAEKHISFQVKIWFQNRRVKYKKEGSDTESHHKCRCLRTCAPRGNKMTQPDDCLKQSTEANHTHAESCATTAADTLSVYNDNSASKCDSDNESLENCEDEHIDCEST